MNIPEKIKIVFYDEKENPISDLLVKVILPVKKKLPYGIGPYLTDLKGIIYLTKTEIISAVNDFLKYDKEYHVIPFEELTNEVILIIKSKDSIDYELSTLNDTFCYYDELKIRNLKMKEREKIMWFKGLYEKYKECYTVTCKNRKLSEDVSIHLSLDPKQEEYEIIVNLNTMEVKKPVQFIKLKGNEWGKGGGKIFWTDSPIKVNPKDIEKM
jgi:hypothetical protein